MAVYHIAGCVVTKEAHAALAAKDAEIERLKAGWNASIQNADNWIRRAEAAEAEVARLGEVGSLVYDEGVRRGIAIECERCARVAEDCIREARWDIAAAIRAG